jgi:DNA-binding transcriptional ArsR family regulator
VTVDVTLQALADPTRRAICQRLAHGRASIGQLAALFPISRPAVSQHVRILAEAGLVETGDGRQRPYQLQAGPLLLLEDWLSGLIQVWEGAPLPAETAPSDVTLRSGT